MTTPEERKRLGQQKSLKGLAVIGIGLVIALIAHFIPWTLMSGLLWVTAVVTGFAGAFQVATAESPIKHLVASFGGAILFWYLTSLSAGGADDFIAPFYLFWYGMVYVLSKGAK